MYWHMKFIYSWYPILIAFNGIFGCFLGQLGDIEGAQHHHGDD